jgi:hypothetical protein
VHEPVGFEAARQQALLSFDDLWIRYLGLGGESTQDEMKGYVEGTASPSSHEHDVLAQALNERFMDMEMDSPVPYSHP